MITPSMPIRLELNGELLGNYFSIPSLKRGITHHLSQGKQGFLQAVDSQGRLIAEHTGLRLTMFPLKPQPRPQTQHTPILIKKGI